MRCPVCRNSDTKVVDSRIIPDGTGVRRRRECAKCLYRFSTFEEVELLDITVVKNKGAREAYSRDKLILGIKSALGKRPYTEAGFHSLIHKIERDIQKKKKREVTSREIGESVMRNLKHFDKIGYIRFASVYRAFEDATSFQSELKNLLRTRARRKTKK